MHLWLFHGTKWNGNGTELPSKMQNGMSLKCGMARHGREGLQLHTHTQVFTAKYMANMGKIATLGIYQIYITYMVELKL